MVGGTDIGGGPDVGRKPVDADPFFPNGDGGHFEAAVPEDLTDWKIPRFFKGHIIDPHVVQDHAELTSELLRTGTDDDLFRLAANTAGLVEVLGDLMAQRRFSPGIALRI